MGFNFSHSLGAVQEKGAIVAVPSYEKISTYVERPCSKSHTEQTAEGPSHVYRMAQKNFFSLNGFSDAGTGDNRGSSLAWASQYDIKSAAAFDTCN